AIGRRSPHVKPIPASFAQQRLWFLARLDGNKSCYNVPMAMRLSGRLHRAALLSALTAIVERHEVLRTRFVEIDGTPYQSIGSADGVCVQEEDLPSEADLRAICEREAREPFDLENDCLIRLRLLTCSEAEHVLLVTMHHC